MTYKDDYHRELCRLIPLCRRASKLQLIQSNIDAGTAIALYLGGTAWGISLCYCIRQPALGIAVLVISGTASVWYYNRAIERLDLSSTLNRYPSELYWQRHQELPVLDRVEAMI